MAEIEGVISDLETSGRARAGHRLDMARAALTAALTPKETR